MKKNKEKATDVNEETIDNEETIVDKEVENNELDLLAQENEKLKAELNEIKDLYLRDKAELENFKKRTNEERIKERKYASASVLQKLISVIDNFERCLAVEKYESVDELRKGVDLINTQLLQALEQEGLTALEVVDKEFDPNYHQAILTDSVEDKENNIILEELQKGYMHKDRILRPAMVKVNQK